VVTLLENAGVSENLAADTVGHDKPRITYGLYSGGASLVVKAEALEKVKYPCKSLGRGAPGPKSPPRHSTRSART
jgi:hypothetical protein